MKCFYYNPEAGSQWETEEETLDEVLTKKLRKLDRTLSKEKIINPDVKGIDDARYSISKFKHGSLTVQAGDIYFHIIKDKDTLYFFKSSSDWFSARYYSNLVNDPNIIDERLSDEMNKIIDEDVSVHFAMIAD